MALFGWMPPSALASDLGDAAKEGSVDKVKSLLAGGANVNERDEKGKTPIMLASDFWFGDPKHEHVILTLLDSGANPDEGGLILKAAWMGSLAVVTKLAEKGADLAVKAAKGSRWPEERNALDMTGGKFNDEIWLFLRSKGVETTRTDFDKALCDAAKGGIPHAVEYFLKKGASINAKVHETGSSMFVMGKAA